MRLLFIDYKNQHVGVICVTGDPEHVHAFANLVKTSMEAMLEYELQMSSERKHRDTTEQFLHYLLFDADTEAGVAERMADKIYLDRDQLRVCLHIPKSETIPPKAILTALSAAEGFSRHDILGTARNDDIILFKALGSDMAKASRQHIPDLKEYYQSVKECLPDSLPKNQLIMLVGTIQRNLKNYRTSFRHAQELGLYITGEHGIFFFEQNIMTYIRHVATIKKYQDIFNAYDHLFLGEDRDQLVEIAEALHKNNYNIAYSAKELYIHRNTMIFRLNKIKEALNIDPVADARDREFFTELAYYLKLRG